MGKFLVLLLGWLATFNVQAQEVCYQWRHNSSASWVSDAGSAASAGHGWCIAVANRCGAFDPANHETCEGVTLIPGTYPAYQWRFKYKQQGAGSCNLTYQAGLQSRVNPDGCPPDPCEPLEGIPVFLGGSGPKPASGYACTTDDGSGGQGNECQVQLEGAAMSTGSGWFGQGKLTGLTAGCDAQPMPDAADKSQPNCVSASGGTVCISKSKQNCGTVNGESVCLDTVPEGSCSLLSGGGAVCDASAGAPPAPTVSEGVPATPDGELTLRDSEGVETTFNYYNSSSVTNSTTTVSGSDNAGSSGDGSGDGTGEGVEECTTDADCFGAFPTTEFECEDFLGCVESAATTAWATTTANVPVLGLASGLYNSLGVGGACPAVPISFMGTDYDLLASGCDLVEEHGGLLELVMQICWSLLGARIVLGGRE